jgi:general secretion pathway protein N
VANRFNVRSGGWLVCCVAMIACGVSADAAAPTTFDIPTSSPSGQVVESLEVGGVVPILSQKPSIVNPPPRGNPLWSIPLSALTATQERPVFSASRRPPPRAVVAPVTLTSAPIPKPVEPEHPALALIGSVVGDNDAIAVFVDRTNQGIVRLRAGDSHAGWLLSSVLPREVTLKKADRTEILALQKPDGPPNAAGASGQVPAPPFSPPAAGANMSYAPFTPRSTPKNGEPDGL